MLIWRTVAFWNAELTYEVHDQPRSASSGVECSYAVNYETLRWIYYF